MRFKLTLENQHKRLLPLNYQHGLSAWIYKTLNYGNEKFADWLHREGYTRTEMRTINFRINILKKKKKKKKIF